MSLVYFWKSYEALIDGSTSLMTHGISLDHVDWWGPCVTRAWNGVKSFGITTSWARVKNGAKKFGCTSSWAAPPPTFLLLNPRCTQHRWSAEQARVDRGTKINGNDEHTVILAGAKKARTLEQLNCWSETASGESSISWTSHSPPHCIGQCQTGQKAKTQEREVLQVYRICPNISLDRARTAMHKLEKADIWPVRLWTSNQIKYFPACIGTADFQKLHFCQKILLLWCHMGKCTKLKGAENREYLELLKEWLLCCCHITQHRLWHSVFQWCLIPNFCLLQELMVIYRKLH